MIENLASIFITCLIILATKNEAKSDQTSSPKKRFAERPRGSPQAPPRAGTTMEPPSQRAPFWSRFSYVSEGVWIHSVSSRFRLLLLFMFSFCSPSQCLFGACWAKPKISSRFGKSPSDLLFRGVTVGGTTRELPTIFLHAICRCLRAFVFEL